MSQTDRRGARILALLAVLWTVASATANLCAVVNGITRKPVTGVVDGFSYDFFADLRKWISTQSCDSSMTSVQWTSDWITNNDIVYSSNGVTGTGAKVQYSLSGSTTGNPFTVVASITLQMTLSKDGASSPATATFGFDVRGVVTDLAGRYPPTWQGSLKTTSTSGLGVFDDDLFDGAGAFVVSDVSAGSMPSSSDMKQAENIARLVAEVNQRFRNFEAVPTALSGDVTARLAFPATSIIASVTTADVHKNGTSGFVASAHGECRGTDCGEDAKRTLLQLAGADTVCQSPSLMSDSMYGSLRATVAVENNKNVHVLGVRATIQAVYACSTGFIGISLVSVADPESAEENNMFSLRLFKEDTRAAIAQVKAIGMEVHGRRYGYVTRDGSTIMTPVETDMFGYGRGGAFVDDVVISDSIVSSFQSAVSNIAKLLSGSYPTVNDVFNSLCDPSSSAEIAQRYFAQVAHPTSYGLWSFWAEQFNGFAVARDVDDNKLILEINSHIHSQYTFESADPSVTSINSVLSAVNSKVKDACGSACSGITAVPTLTAASISSSKLDIAVSASVSIPTMSLSMDSLKSNSAMKQMHIIRRENALNGPEDVHMEFVAEITASLASQASTLDQVTVMYSSVLDKAAMSKGTLVSTVTGVAAPVGMGANGQVFFNSNIAGSLLSTFASNLASAANSVSEQEGTTLQSLTQLNDHASSQTLSQLLTSVSSGLPKSGDTTVIAYFDSVRDLLEKSLIAAGVIPMLSLAYNSDNTISLDLAYVSVRRIGFEASGAYWTKNVPVSRTELTLPLSSRVSLVFGSSSSVKSFQIQGYSHAQGFSLPIREGMRVGLALAGFAETVVNIPTFAYLTVSFNGKMERGSTFSGTFRGNMTVTDPNTPLDQLFYFNMEEDNRGGYGQEADPSATLAALSNNFVFPSLIAQHQLKDNLAPFNKPIIEIIDLESSWKERTTWVFSSEAYPYVYVNSVSFPFSGFTETVNISVNSNYTYTNCVFNIPSASSINELVSSMTQAIASCGDLSSFVTVSYTDGKDSDLSLVMSPVYAGSIYNFIISAPNTSQSIMRSQSWSASRVTPDHLSWNDLYDGVYLALLKPTPSYSYAEPEFKSVNVADAHLVDASRAQFYPTEVSGVFFKAAVKYHNPPKRIPIEPDFPAEDNNISVLLLPTNATVEGDVSMSVTFGMALWCSLGDGTIPFFTSFTSDAGNRYDDVKVPAAPDNTFTISAVAEKRLASAVTSTPALETISQTITLTPGKLLLDALVEEFPKQLSGIGAQMITVERRTDPSYPTDIQAAVKFKTYSPDSNTLYVPLEFSVLPNKLGAFGSSSSISQMKAVTSCPLAKDFHLNVDVQSSPNLDDGDENGFGLGDIIDCRGTLGVTEIAKCNAQMTVKHSFSVTSAKSLTLLGDIYNVIPDRQHFSDWFKNVANLSTSLNVNNLTFKVANNKMSDLASESVILNQIVSLPFNALKNASETVYSIDIPSTKPTGRALASLLTTNKKTFCSGLKQSFDKVTNFAEADEMNQILPFTSQHMSPIFSTLINEHLEEAMDSVCDITNDRVSTLSGFCDELKSKFGFDICGNATLSDDGLDIPLLMKPEMAYAPVAFQFDSQRIITNASFSTAFGNSGDLVLDAEVAAIVGLKLAFLERNKTSEDDEGTEYYSEAVLDAKTTTFSSKVSLDSSPRVRTLLGTTVVTFDSQALNLDVAITGGISDNSDAVEVDLEGSAHLDAHTANEDSSYYCHVTAEVPVVRHYFYPPANAWEDTVTFSDNCLQGSFVQGVESSFDNMTLAHYFEQDPNNFFKQFNSGLAKDLFDYILDYVTNRAIAYLGKNIQALCAKAFDKIVGPDVAARIGDEITDMVANVIKSGQYPNTTDLERVVLTFFTGILNKVFQPYLRSEIPTPEPGDVITWQFRFGGDTTKQLNSIDWSCGDHGIADFEVKSDNSLLMSWSVSFDVVWNKSAGVSIAWPVSPALDGSITLSGQGLDLSGSLLFLTADLNGALTVRGELSANPAQKDINFVVDAELDTTGKLGLVQKIRQETKGEKANALGALPYVSAGVKASWAFNWGTQNPKPTMPHSFQFTEPELCLGSLITEFMQQVCREVNRVIEPLDPIFGPDGILQKPIPGLSKIFGSHCNVLSIMEWTCEMFSSSCNINTVRKLIDVLNDIAADIGKIKEFMSYMQNPEGCMDFSYIYRTFNISWDKDQPTPDDPDSGNGIIPMTPTEKFYNSVPSSEQQPLRNIMAKWAPSNTAVIRSDCVDCTEANATIVNDGDNKFGFKLDILENFPEKLITILLGGNVALFSVSFPEASFSYSISWSIPVWDVPYVAVTIHAGASVSFQPPSVALMSNAIIDTVKTGNPSHLFRNLAVSTTTAFATGTLEVDGGAEGGIHIIIAKVTVNFDVTVKFIVQAKVANFNGDDWATFDTIFMQVKKYGFNGAIQFSLQLRGGFKLYLQGCVNVLFIKKCWTIVSWSWDTTLWSWEPKNDLITSVASASGAIDGSSFDFTYPVYEPHNLLASGEDTLRTYVITNNGVMFMPANIQEGNAALTRNLASSIGVSFGYSMPCTSEYNIVIDGDITRPSLTMPSSCDKVHIIIKQMGYRTVEQYTITASSVTPLGRSAISFSTAASISLEEPVYGIQYILSGSPAFPLSIDTEYSSAVNLTGSASNYKGSVTITGAVPKIFVALSCGNLSIASTTITCDSAVFTIPETVEVIRVAAVDPPDPDPHPHPHPDPRPIPPPEPINITIDDVPGNRSVEIVGASPLVSVKVPAMQQMTGTVSVVGNTADDNYIHVNMDTPLDRDIVATAYPSQLAYNDSDTNDTHVIRHANVNVRSYSLKAAPGRKSTMRVISPTSYESVSVDMIGAKDAILRNELEGCDKRSMVNVSMSDEGTQTLVLGVNGKLSNIQCSLRVFTDGLKNAKDSVREIIVNATLDERPLNWVFSDGEFSASNSLDSSDVFHVYTNGLDHVTIHFSKINDNQLTFDKSESDGMEYVFVFPDKSSSSMSNDFSTVQVSQTHSPILIQGPVMNVILGDPEGSVTPLSQIGALVVAPSGSNIIMNSQNTVNATHIAISDNCVFEQQSAPVSKPSDWFIKSVKDLGIDYSEGCNVLVPKVTSSQNAGFSTTFDITAGSGDDSLDAMNPAVHVVANMGDGDDNVNWFSPESTSRLFLQMGNGADTLSVQSAGPVNVDLGDDDEPDYLTVVCQDVSPSIIRSSIFPIGVRSDTARLEISQWDSSDTIEIARFSLNPPKERESAIISSDVPGAKIKYQQNDNTDYIVSMCTDKSVIDFTTRYQGFDRAEDTGIEIALDTYDNNCTVTVDGAPNTNGSVLIGVDSNAQTVPNELILNAGSAVFGATRVTLGYVDHVGVSISPAFAENGTLTIAGPVANQDVFVNLPMWLTNVSKEAKDLIIMSTFGEVHVNEFDPNGKGMIISLNEKESSTQLLMVNSSMKEFTMTNGCIESKTKKTLSKWMIERAKEAGFDVSAEQKCSALFRGLRYLVLDDNSTCKKTTMSGLGWDTVRSVWLPKSVEDIVVESTNTETKDSLWTGARMTDDDIMFSKKNEDAFHINAKGDKVNIKVASAVFAPWATFMVNCTNTNYHHHWNIALDKAHDSVSDHDRSYYADINFTSNGATCSGRINNYIFADMRSAPSVHLVPGLGASVLVETFGTKDASKIERAVNLSNSEGMNKLRFHSFDRSTEELQVEWDAQLGGGVTVHLGDRSENAIIINPDVTKLHPLYLSAAAHSALSFPNLGNHSIAFEGVDPEHFNVATKSFDLLGGKSNSTGNVFCFTPCDMCSAATWDEIRTMGQPCTLEKSATSMCAENADIHVTQESIPALLGVSCGKAHWDPSKVSSDECSIAFNENGAAGEYTNVIPEACKAIAGIVVVAAAVATVIGASVLASRLIVAVGKTVVSGINRWWLSNMMRDFFNDQFSWASIVLTACLGGISNYDISNWGGPIDGLVLEVKNLLFDWMDFCKTNYPPVVVASWFVALVVLTLRMVTAVGTCKDTMKWRRALRIIDPIHAIASSLSLMMLPLAGYAVSVLMKVNALPGVATLLSAICIIASVPVGSFNAATRMRVIASYIAVGLPFIMSIVAGAGASRGLILAMLLVSAVLLPVCNTFVLWKSFFAGADTRTKTWKHSLFWTFGLRAASMIFGLIFLLTLFFDLPATASGFAYAFWMLWVLLPPLQLIPLLAGVKSSNIVPRDYRANSSIYGPINSGETTPLRSGMVTPAASLSTLSNIPVCDKDMSDVAAA